MGVGGLKSRWHKLAMQQPHQMLLQAFALVNAGRLTEALPVIQERVDLNDPLALNLLAEMVWGGTLKQDPVAARHLFRRAADAGHSDAAIRYTNLLANGVAGPRDWSAALGRLRREAGHDATRARVLSLIEAMTLTVDGEPAMLPSGERLAETPQATLFRRLISSEECGYLLATAAPSYQPSTVYNSARQLVRDPMRTSDCSALHWLIEDPVIHAINRRLAAASGTVAEQGEAGQILRYQPGQQYRPHFDFVRASDNQRVLTALIYLNGDYEGGETRFVRTGLQVKGDTGDVLVFRNALPDRTVDPASEHAGLPVTRGTKYLYSRWIHERRWQP
jgi:prolyl 4-hydroxylase